MYCEVLHVFIREVLLTKSSPQKNEKYLNIWARSRRLHKLLTEESTEEQEWWTNLLEAKHVKDTQQALMSGLPCYAFIARPFRWVDAIDHFHCRKGRYMTAERRNMPRERKKIELEQLRLEECYFSLLKDTTGDTLTIEGLQDFFVHHLKVGALSEAEMRSIFQSIDRDKDGSISMQEFQEFITSSVWLSRENNTSTKEYTVEGDWETHYDVVEDVLCQRFARYFQHDAILHLAVDGLFTTILANLKRVAEGENTQNKVSLFSAHDMTLLPCLFALGAWDGASAWPGYGAALAIELHEDAEGTHFLAFKQFRGFNKEGVNKDDRSRVPFFETVYVNGNAFIELSEVPAFLNL